MFPLFLTDLQTMLLADLYHIVIVKQGESDEVDQIRLLAKR